MNIPKLFGVALCFVDACVYYATGHAWWVVAGWLVLAAVTARLVPAR